MNFLKQNKIRHIHSIPQSVRLLMRIYDHNLVELLDQCCHRKSLIESFLSRIGVCPSRIHHNKLRCIQIIRENQEREDDLRSERKQREIEKYLNPHMNTHTCQTKLSVTPFFPPLSLSLLSSNMAGVQLSLLSVSVLSSMWY